MRPLRTLLGTAFVLACSLVAAAPASAAPAGSLVFTSTRDGADGDVFVQNADGTGLVQLTGNGALEADAAWSPDGTKIAFTRRVVDAVCPTLGCLEVFVMNADGSDATRITHAPADGKDDRAPAWSPDGQWIAYNTMAFGAKDVMKVPVTGGDPVRLTSDPAHDYAPTWSPDGSTIAFVSHRTGAARLFTMAADGGGQTQLDLSGAAAPKALIGDPAFAPDGTRLSFRGAVDQWSLTGVYVTNLSGGETATVWTTPETKTWYAYDPSWSPDGGSLAFSVDTSTSSGFDLAIVDLATSVWSWAQRGVGDDLNPDWAAVSAPTVPPQPVGAAVTVSSYSFSPSDPAIQLGDQVRWEFAAVHTATDRTGLALYDSGPRDAGDTFSYGFTSAGSFAFNCTLHPRKMRGSVNVPVSLDPTTGGTGTSFTVRWASAAPPAGAVFEVKVLRPGAKKWVTWKDGVTGRSASFVPDAGRGSYAFKARVLVSSKRTSGYSPVVSIVVS